MNTFVTIVEVVELGALIALVIYLIRLTRDNKELRGKLNKSDLIDRNLDELNDFNGAMVADPDIARLWQDGCEDYRLRDIDRSRFSLLASQYLTMLANQKQRADSIDEHGLAEVATGKLIDTLTQSPGLVAVWDNVAEDIASPELRERVAQALSATAPEELEVIAEIEAPAEPVEESTVVEETALEETARGNETSEAEVKVKATAATDQAEVSEPEQVAETAAVPEQETSAADSVDDEESTKVDTAETTAVANEETTDSGQAADQPLKSSGESSVAVTIPEPVHTADTDAEDNDSKSDTEVAVAKPA